jgi:hypothetical protein
MTYFFVTDKGEFKEGVSLTAFDELLRWEKYAYGCSELVCSLLTKAFFSFDLLLIVHRYSTLSTNGLIAVLSPGFFAVSSGLI